MARARRPAARKPLATKDSNVIQPPPQPQQQQLQQQDEQLLPDVKEQMMDANHREAERRVAAIRAVRDAEVESYLTQLRMALSMLPEEVKSMPLDEFVDKFCPDRQIVKSLEGGILELRPKSSATVTTFEYSADKYTASHGISCRPTPLGFPFTSSAVKEDLLYNMDRFAHDESEDEEFMKFMQSFRSSKFCSSNLATPTNNNTTTVGLTPRSLRLPKKGEALLSVNGSPLGVYDKDEISAIPEERPKRARRRLRSSGTTNG